MTLDSKHNIAKLDSLKNKPSKTPGLGFLVSKNKLKTQFFTVLTILLLVGIFATNFIASSLKSLENIQDNRSEIISSLTKLLENNNSNPEEVLYEIKTNLLSSLKPVNSLLLTEKIVENDINKIIDLANLWVSNVDSLAQYSISQEGFKNNFSNKTFTADLEIFFDVLPQLITETESLYNSFWHYRVFINTFGEINQKKALKSIKEGIKLLKIIDQNKQSILELLGHYTTKQIVVFNQNTGEARATGGFYGSYLPITISQGVLKVGQSQSIYYVDGSKDVLNFTHPAYTYYGFGRDSVPVVGARDLNFTPCFPITAKLIEQEFSSSDNGYTIDHLLMINPGLIQSILPDGLVLNIPGVGSINKDNFLDEVERLTSLSVQFSPNPKFEISNIFKSILEQLPAIISSQGSLSLVNKIIDAIESRDLQMWFKYPQINEFFEAIGLGSSQVCHKDDTNIITPLLTNFSADKRNLVSENTFSISAKRQFGRVDFSIKYSEYIPPKTFLQRGFNEQTGHAFIGLQLPNSSSNFAVNGPSVLNRSLVRPFAKAEALEQNTKELSALPEAEIINLTSRNIPGGFTYTQFDGSTVLGTFITSKSGFNEVEFSFSLPINSYEKFSFYGQPGLNKPIISIGENIRSVSSRHQKYFDNPQEIQKGIDLYLE